VYISNIIFVLKLKYAHLNIYMSQIFLVTNYVNILIFNLMK